MIDNQVNEKADTAPLLNSRACPVNATLLDPLEISADPQGTGPTGTPFS